MSKLHRVFFDGIPIALVCTLLTCKANPASPSSKEAAISSDKSDAQNITVSSSSHVLPGQIEQTETNSPPEGMLLVPGGRFVMGLDDGGDADERPAHTVTVSSFFLDITEVDNTSYKECVDAGACRKPAFLHTEKGGFEPLEAFRTPNRPVNGVSHDDAETYCRFMQKRLPTEAEWERAARGSDNRLYPWGNEEPTRESAVFRTDVTAPVGSLAHGHGPFGHLDLAGNLWEWVSDHYDPLAYTRRSSNTGRPADCGEILRTQDTLRKEGRQGFTGTNPIPTECEYVLRGGAFNYSGKGLRSTNRVHHAGHFRIAMAGFRCAKDP